jgi:hypothetical protein
VFQFFEDLIVVGGQRSHDDVAVASQVFGARVHHDVDAEFQRFLPD